MFICVACMWCVFFYVWCVRVCGFRFIDYVSRIRWVFGVVELLGYRIEFVVSWWREVSRTFMKRVIRYTRLRGCGGMWVGVEGSIVSYYLGF